jgi:hypothetical protein
LLPNITFCEKPFCSSVGVTWGETDNNGEDNKCISELLVLDIPKMQYDDNENTGFSAVTMYISL